MDRTLGFLKELVEANGAPGFEGDVATQGAGKGERMVNGWKNNSLPWSYKLDRGKLMWDRDE